MKGLESFEPSRHVPVTENDRNLIESALWQGWELMVDNWGVVWIGAREEKVAAVAVISRKMGLKQIKVRR